MDSYYAAFKTPHRSVAVSALPHDEDAGFPSVKRQRGLTALQQPTGVPDRIATDVDAVALLPPASPFTPLSSSPDVTTSRRSPSPTGGIQRGDWDDYLPQWADMTMMLGEYLEARDVATLRLVSKLWYSAGSLLVLTMHKLSCSDVAFLQGANLQPRPESMRRVERLDLRRYGAVPTPTRPSRDGPATPARLERAAWITSLVDNDAACGRLKFLALGPMVPSKMMERLLRRCGRLESLSLRGSERLKDEVGWARRG